MNRTWKKKKKKKKVMMLPPKTVESKPKQISIPAHKTAAGLITTLLVGKSEGAGLFSFANGPMNHVCEKRSNWKKKAHVPACKEKPVCAATTLEEIVEEQFIHGKIRPVQGCQGWLELSGLVV